jgi:hypothetical protein
MKTNINTIIWLTIFSIAMGFMESAVVIYLREIYYPGGFRFPLVPLDINIGLVELLREASTVIMLLGIGILAAKKASLRFAYFIYCFAIWDLCYYLFLWLFLGWPESLLTWDILFLIPVPWVGPVIAPCIISLTMIILAMSIIHYQNSGFNSRLNLKEWMLFITGSLVVIVSFIWDYLRYVSRNNIIDETNQQTMLDEIKNYVPVEFNWSLFITGELIILLGIIMFIIRLKKEYTSVYNHHLEGIK